MSADIRSRALNWIVGRDTGLSSEALWANMMGAEPARGWSYPHDPDDLGRCLRLLELIPEWKERLQEMAVRGTPWAALVENWTMLHALMDDEVGIDWSKARRAPRTYDAMKQVLDPVEK